MIRATLILLFTTSFVRAQPVIDHLAVDEAQSKLLIYGAFDQVGTVTIDSVAVTVIDWTDSLITTSLPDSGQGAGGNVVVTEFSGTSTPRRLSIIKLKISNPAFVTLFGPVGKISFIRQEERKWNVNWRTDLKARKNPLDTLIRFEIAKSSFGERYPCYFYHVIPWSDTSREIDSSISLAGYVNLKSGTITFDIAKLHMPPPNCHEDKILYQPKKISFDSTGYITGYIDSGRTLAPGTAEQWDNRIYDTEILFAPNPKVDTQSTVRNFYVSPSIISELRTTNNPFQDGLDFTIRLNQATTLNLNIFDGLGKEVHAVNLGYKFLGEFLFSLEALPDWPSGIYYARLAASNGEVKTVKFVKQ